MLLFSPAVLAAAVFLVPVLYMVTCFLSPLCKIPGPIYSNFTSVVLRWNELQANRTRYIHQLHQRYGPVVRIAPREVAFTSMEAVKEIYCSGGSGYDKSGWYDLFKIFGRRTMFTTLNKNGHATRKRVLADRYANTNIMRQAAISGIEERSRNFIRRCSESLGRHVDIYIDSLRNQHDEEIMKEVTLDNSLQNRLVRYYSPTLHKLISKVLNVFAKPRETPLADDFVLRNSEARDTAPFTLLSRLWDKSHHNHHLLDPTDIAAECLDHMVAGIDTTGDALCFLMWELSQPSSVRFQDRLRQEVRAAARPDEVVAFDKLPFLDAVVLEGLRCFPSIPMSLPRVVPRGGRVIDGFALPEGTVVSCQALSVHMINAHVFPEPERFNPDRWLQDKGDFDRKRLFFAFASGGRGCIGKHLATAEMKVLLRDVYSRFRTVPADFMTAEMMGMSDQLISSQPAAKQCCLQFIPVEEKGVGTGVTV